MLAEEVYPIYYKDDLYNPHVDLELEGEKISFIIDTGAVYSMVSLKLLQEWDWVEYIEPVAESHETIGCIGLELRLKGTIFTDKFLVIPQDYNMLGTRALSHFNAIIDLDSHKLTLREFVPEVWEKEAVDVVCVEGQEVSVFVDTGYEGFLEG